MSIGLYQVTIAVLCVDHAVQLRGGIFDVAVLVLTGSALRSQYSAAVDTFKITMGKFMPSRGILWLLIIDPQIPHCVFPESICREELIFRLRGQPVLAPCISSVEHKAPAHNEFLSKVE
jgi:hypothetical protein